MTAYLCSSSLAQAVGEGTTRAHLKAVGDPVQGHGGFVAQATGESTHPTPPIRRRSSSYGGLPRTTAASRPTRLRALQFGGGPRLQRSGTQAEACGYKKQG